MIRFVIALLASALMTAASDNVVDVTVISATGEASSSSSSTSNNNSPYEPLASNATAIEYGAAMIAWVRAHGGFVHPALHVNALLKGPDGTSLTNTPYGLFTSEPLKAGETILVIPGDLIVTSEGTKDECDTARNLHRELQLGKDSKYAPYVTYLLETQQRGQVPHLWSEDGRELLINMLRVVDEDDEDEDEPKLLPPYVLDSWEYLERCDVQPEEEQAFEFLRYRGWDDVLVPLYDMMSHANGRALNTVSSTIASDVSQITIQTNQDVPANGQLFCSYNVYEGSKNLNELYGTPEILMDFGFVEGFPQRWIFDKKDYWIDPEVDEGEDDENDITLAFELDKPDDGTVTVSWLREPMDAIDAQFALDAVDHLTVYANEYLRENNNDIPQQEWDTILQYNRAMIFALEAALEVHFYDPMKIGADDTNSVNPELFSEDRHYTCDHFKTHEFAGHETVEQIFSHYQRLEFDIHPVTKQTCFWLDMYVQQCTSYRPHYHEPAIHFTARYLEKVQRIAWIGGGDSMLLHDALKYPSLELALGLELDQMVTRYNFKYMGSQPHYDNEKVQWWYGDATKSLLMLPQDYFGSFDMIVIDLSDTAMQMSVTSDLSIFSALSLLLKKGGIMVKNEEYLEQFSRVFDYTIQMHYYDVPVVCSQSFILGSYGTDFLNIEPKDHKPTDLMYVNNRPDIQSKFGIWHDYRRNITRTNAHCKDDLPLPEPTEQTTSPGILMVVEAEQVSKDLKNTKKIKDELVKALEKAKLKVIEAVVVEESNMIGLVLNAGYVVARLFPEASFCAFDSHFWGSFELQEGAKKALVGALGGGKKKSSVSSYRVVAGGMFGVDSWKEDSKKQGPRKVHECDKQSTTLRGSFTNQTVVDYVTEELLKLLTNKESDTSLDVLVACGKENEECLTPNTIKSFDGVGNVLTLRACDKAVDFQTKQICEESVMQTLVAFAGKQPTFSGFDAMIIDPEAPLEVMQILFSMFNTENVWKTFTKDKFLIIANSMDTSLTTRRGFLDRFRRDNYDPMFRAEILFNTTDSSLEAGVLVAGFSDGIEQVTATVETIEKATGLVSEVRTIAGGMFTYQYDFDPEFVYSHSDFDMRDTLEQWKSQSPTGFQTIFQLLKLSPEEQLDVHDKIFIQYPDDQQWYPGRVVWVHSDGTVDVRYDSGDLGKGLDPSMVQKDTSDMVVDDQKRTIESQSLSGERIKEALQSALVATKFENMEQAKLYQYSGVGEGSLTLAFWPGGNAVALWDGRSHIDINLFTYTESVDIANKLVEHFKESIPFLKTALRDEQPRGYGRIVNYHRDIEEYKGRLPVWAEHLVGTK